MATVIGNSKAWLTLSTLLLSLGAHKVSLHTERVSSYTRLAGDAPLPPGFFWVRFLSDPLLATTLLLDLRLRCASTSCLNEPLQDRLVSGYGREVGP